MFALFMFTGLHEHTTVTARLMRAILGNHRKRDRRHCLWSHHALLLLSLLCPSKRQRDDTTRPTTKSRPRALSKSPPTRLPLLHSRAANQDTPIRGHGGEGCEVWQEGKLPGTGPS
jgi:hypothetical protein